MASEDMDIGDLSSDDQIRESAARYLQAPAAKLAMFTINRNPETGDITLAPPGVFG